MSNRYDPSLHLYRVFSANTIELIGELYIGNLRYTKYMSGYNEKVRPDDVMSALTLLTYLYLEGYNVEEDVSKLEDSAMLLIKASGADENLGHFNSIGRVNKTFITFVIDFLALSYLFDAYAVHKTGKSPSPFMNRAFTNNERNMFMHNQQVLITFLLNSSHNVHATRHIDEDGWMVDSKYLKTRLC